MIGPMFDSRRIWTMAFKFLFAASLVAIAFAATYASSPAAFSEYDLGNILVLGAAINIVALLGALLLLRRKNVANAVLSLIVLAGIGTAHVVHTELWLAGNRVVLVALCAMSFAGLFVAFRVIDELRWGGVALSVSALLGLWMIAGGHLMADRTPVSGDVSNIRNISFQRTPNLYFVSFESLVPRSLLRKHFGVETTRFHDLFEDKMRPFSNFFTEAAGTLYSVSAVLALDLEVFLSQREMLQRKDEGAVPYMFSGRDPSPLLDILRRNGYETTSIFRDSYLGGKFKGPYVDNYVTLVKKSVCDLLDPNLRNIAFWGYCHWFEQTARERKRDFSVKWTVEEIAKASANDKPQFVMAHLLHSWHTMGGFHYGNPERLEKFTKRYVSGANKAGRSLRSIIRHLEENDPGSILLVYGDHGPYLSRGFGFKDDPAFFVQDRYGVIGGVWPRDTCAAWFDEASAEGWMTVTDAVHALLRCLSGGESALVGPRKRYVLKAGQVHPSFDFKEFLYE